VSDDGLVYVADRENRRVQVFTTEGKFVKQLVKGDIPFARDLAFSPDPQQQFLYVGGGSEIVVLDRKTLEIVESIKGEGMLGGGHQMATDSKGNIYRLKPPADFRSWRLKECRRHRADELWADHSFAPSKGMMTRTRILAVEILLAGLVFILLCGFWKRRNSFPQNRSTSMPPRSRS